MNLPTPFLLILTLLVVLTTSSPSLKCMAYLVQLQALYQVNQGLFFKQIAPYMLYSGKQLDDMGFPKMCKDKEYGYTTAKIDAFVYDQHVTQHQDFIFTFYYGFCFTNLCTFSDLNSQGKFIVDNIFKQTAIKIEKVTFYDVEMQYQFSPLALIVCLLFITWFFITMVGPISRWIHQCKQKPQQKSEIQIQLQQNLKQQKKQQVQVYEQPIKSGFFHTISIGHRWFNLFRAQQSTKIMQFSYFKLVAVPLTIYGYYFYLCNLGSFNIFSFNSQIYTSFYSKVATFAYYLPDIFFFISGYLLAKKVFTEIQFTTNGFGLLGKVLLGKFVRLYPLYIVVLGLFVWVLPALHTGPMWQIYSEEIARCGDTWWRNLLMIDNLWTEGCFEFSWWVQAEIQFTILALFTFAVIFINKKIGSILLYLQLLAGWILLFTISQKLPIQLQATISPHSQSYFKSFHSHIPFYLTGVLLALTFKKESSRRFVIKYYFKNFLLFVFVLVLAAFIFAMVLFRPFLFEYDALGFQLGLCRMGVVVCFVVWCMPAFVKERSKRTRVHKLANLTYPVILVAGLIVAASYWALQTFPYTSEQSLLYNMFPNLFLSITIGVVLHLLFNFKNASSQKQRVI